MQGLAGVTGGEAQLPLGAGAVDVEPVLAHLDLVRGEGGLAAAPLVEALQQAGAGDVEPGGEPQRRGGHAGEPGEPPEEVGEGHVGAAEEVALAGAPAGERGGEGGGGVAHVDEGDAAAGHGRDAPLQELEDDVGGGEARRRPARAAATGSAPPPGSRCRGGSAAPSSPGRSWRGSRASAPPPAAGSRPTRRAPSPRARCRWRPRWRPCTIRFTPAACASSSSVRVHCTWSR